MNKKVLFIMADFETSKISECVNDGVYAWLTGFKVCGLMEFEYIPQKRLSKKRYINRKWIGVSDYLSYIPLDFKYFYGKSALIDWLNAIFDICFWCKQQGIEVKVFFHNAQYDFSYIQYLILKEFQGYSKKEFKEGIYITQPIIDGNNTFYQAAITCKKLLKTGDKKNKQYTLKFTIHDLYKILPSPLADIGQSVGVEKLKEIFDYTRIIPYDYIPSDDDIKYFYNDIEIMNIAYKKLPEFFYGYYTIGSIAKNYFLDNHVNKKDLFAQNKLFPKDGLCTEYGFYNTNNVKISGFTPFKHINKEILKGYKGGMTIANKKYIGKTLYNKILPVEYIPQKEKEFINDKLIYHYDVNSLYPSVMHDEKYPIGLPEIFYNLDYNDMNVFENYLINLMNKGKKIIIEVDIVEGSVKPDKAPLFLKHDETSKGIDCLTKISIDNSYKAFYEKISDPTEFITLEEFLLLKENYNFKKYIIQKAYVFHSIENLFKGYVDEISTLKIENDNDTFLRNCYKLMLNNLYGKFGENNDKENLKRLLDSNGEWYTKNIKSYEGNQEGNILTETVSDYFYPAIAVYVTSYARMKMIKFINLINWDNIIYMDTDSLHCIGEECKRLLESNNFVDNVKLGLLKLEDVCYSEKALSPKKYCYYGIKLKNNKKDFFVKCAGLPENAQKLIKDFNQFDYGLTFIPKEFINEENKTYTNKNKKGIVKGIDLPKNYIPIGKLQKKLIKGGIYLSDAIFSIKTPDYITIKNEEKFLNNIEGIENYLI